MTPSRVHDGGGRGVGDGDEWQPVPNEDLMSSGRISGSSSIDTSDANWDLGRDPAMIQILVQPGDPASAQTSIHPNQPKKRRDVFGAAVVLIAPKLYLGGEPAMTHVPVQVQPKDKVSAKTSIEVGGGGLEPNTNSTTNSTVGPVKLKRGMPKKRAKVPVLNIGSLLIGQIACPHLDSHFPRGIICKGIYITPKHAASLQTFGLNQVPSLVYDDSEKGFSPREWHFRVIQNEDEDVHLLLLDQYGGGNGQRNIMYIHRSREED